MVWQSVSAAKFISVICDHASQTVERRRRLDSLRRLERSLTVIAGHEDGEVNDPLYAQKDKNLVRKCVATHSYDTLNTLIFT